MRKVELLFAAILVPLDYIMLFSAAWLAYVIRFDESILGIRQAVYTLPLDQFLKTAALTSCIMVLIFAWSGLYSISGTRRIVDEFRKIVLACSAGILLILVLLFVNRDLFSSRFIILTAWVLSIVLVAVERFAVIQIERALFKKGIGIHNVLLIGEGHTASILHTELQNSNALGLRIVERATTVQAGFVDKVSKIIRVKQIDEIILASSTITRPEVAELIQFCRANQVEFKYAADTFDAQSSHISIRPIAGIPIVEIRPTPLNGWGKIFKRLLDIVLATCALIVFGPIMLATALAVKLDSTGPIIYRNRRVGQNGKEFDTFKFRSMKQEFCISDENPEMSEALRYEEKLIEERSIKAGPIYKIKDDPRVTRIGHIIRTTSLDEFPQFVNVLLGQMSLVGPRPHQPREVAHYDKHHYSLFTMKPGVSGLAQISGRSDLEFEEEVRLDNYYMENWSIMLDLYILVKTPLVLLKKRKAA